LGDVGLLTYGSSSAGSSFTEFSSDFISDLADLGGRVSFLLPFLWLIVFYFLGRGLPPFPVSDLVFYLDI
jgi:hypothetical protein